MTTYAEIVHACPPDGSGRMPCCGRTPFEVPKDRMTLDPALVTCDPPLKPCSKCGADGYSFCRDGRGEPLVDGHVDRTRP